jgi:hypothetical protein
MNEKKLTPQKPSTFIGLCQSCKFIDNCKLKSKHNTTVFQCEEFEINKPMNVKETIKETSCKISPKKEIYTGLCKNCLKRKTCSYRNPVSVIWHCEEYE